MSVPLFIKGFIIGLALAAPVGPIGILCIHRSLTDRLAAGLAVGLGAATADGLYGLIAAFGITAVSSFLIYHLTLLRIIGGIFLALLGIKILLKPVVPSSTITQQTSIVSAYFSTVLLTLTNPVTILAFAGIFAGLGLGQAVNDYFSAIKLTVGVFLGSAVWFTSLSTVVNLFKNQCNLNVLKWANRISGIILIAFGLAAIISILKI